MTADTCTRMIREFVRGSCSARAMSDDQDVFADGLVNSLFAMQLVLFVEKTFGIAVADDDLDFDNFRTVNAIAAFVARKLNARGAPGAEPAPSASIGSL